MTANELRGEIALRLGRKSYVLRPSHEAIVAFEAETGCGSIVLARAADDRSLSLAQAAAISAECIRAQGRAVGDTMLAAVDDTRIGEMIAEAGLLTVLRPIARMLYLSVTGGVTASGEVKAMPNPVETIPGVARRGSRRRL